MERAAAAPGAAAGGTAGGAGGRLSPAPRAGSEAAAADTSEPERSPPWQVSCSFQKFSLPHLCSSSGVLPAPSLPCAPPPPSLPPGRRGLPPSLRVPSGEFLDQVVLPIGRRGGEGPGEEGVGGQSGSHGRGRSWAGAGRLRGGRATREAARWPLKGWRGAPAPSRRGRAG